MAGQVAHDLIFRYADPDSDSRTLEPEMACHPPRPAGWTSRHLRHIAGIFWQDRNPAARVYESIGSDFFLAPAPGWLNLGLWEGPGSEDEADAACRRLVQTVAAALPQAGVILDVGNGLGTQDPVIAEVLYPRRLVAVNITEWQLSAGRDRLREAAAPGVAGDATRLPIADQSIDGVISVEAAFHFRSRRAFFEECFRVLKPGGMLSISDVATERLPLRPLELLAGVTQMRVFGLHPSAAMTADQIANAARAAGFTAVDVTVCGNLVIAPALQLIGRRLRTFPGAPAAPAGQRTAARLLLGQAELLWRRGIIQYILLRAVRP
jgi:ubiquinone/menaquinone biosynthesis C-methylase UbiE